MRHSPDSLPDSVVAAKRQTKRDVLIPASTTHDSVQPLQFRIQYLDSSANLIGHFLCLMLLHAQQRANAVSNLVLAEVRAIYYGIDLSRDP
jgi:hypothetical protein